LRSFVKTQIPYEGREPKKEAESWGRPGIDASTYSGRKAHEGGWSIRGKAIPIRSRQQEGVEKAGKREERSQKRAGGWYHKRRRRILRQCSQKREQKESSFDQKYESRAIRPHRKKISPIRSVYVNPPKKKNTTPFAALLKTAGSSENGQGRGSTGGTKDNRRKGRHYQSTEGSKRPSRKYRDTTTKVAQKKRGVNWRKGDGGFSLAGFRLSLRRCKA